VREYEKGKLRNISKIICIDIAQNRRYYMEPSKMKLCFARFHHFLFLKDGLRSVVSLYMIQKYQWKLVDLMNIKNKKENICKDLDIIEELLIILIYWNY